MEGNEDSKIDLTQRWWEKLPLASGVGVGELSFGLDRDEVAIFRPVTV